MQGFLKKRLSGGVRSSISYYRSLRQLQVQPYLGMHPRLRIFPWAGGFGCKEHGVWPKIKVFRQSNVFVSIRLSLSCVPEVIIYSAMNIQKALQLK